MSFEGYRPNEDPSIPGYEVQTFVTEFGAGINYIPVRDEAPKTEGMSTEQVA